MRRAFKDAEFHREYKKLAGEDPDPLTPEEMEKTNREMSLDAEVIELLKKTFRRGPASRAITTKAARLWLRRRRRSLTNSSMQA